MSYQAAARPGFLVLWEAAVALMPEWTRSELGLTPPSRRHTRLATAGGHLGTRTLRWVSSPIAERARRIEEAARESAPSGSA